MVETEEERLAREAEENRQAIIDSANEEAKRILAEAERTRAEAEALKIEAEGAQSVFTEESSDDLLDVYFLGVKPRTTPRTDTELGEQTVGVSKKQRDDLKLKDNRSYQKLKDKAQEGIPKSFELMEKIDLEDKKLDQIKGVSSFITSLDRLKRNFERVDIHDVFQIPDEFEETVIGNWIPTRRAKKIDLFQDYNNIDLEVVKRANSYFLRYGANYHAENVTWSGEAILNSDNT